MKILVTGSAGFIGYFTCKALLERGDTVIGLDNFNEYYDVTLKHKRTAMLEQYPNFTLIKGDITNKADLAAAFALLSSGNDTRVCHLAAQAGVRHSIANPDIFIHDNIEGFQNILEHVRLHQVGGLIYASSSSVYGNNTKQPYNEDDKTDLPVSLYGLTKKTNELQAYSYHTLFGTKSTGLRFFTVYGPWGRPDMALFLFTNWINNNEPMQIFGEGKMQRDFTYVADIVQGIVAALDKNYDCEVFNLAGGKTEELMDYVKAVEQALGKEGTKEYLPMQLGDVVSSNADITKAQTMLGYKPTTSISQGVPKFVDWYKEHYAK